MLPILLIHGFPFDGSMWASQAAFLRDKGYTVLTPTLPGFGGTAPLPREQTSMEAFAAGIHAVIDKEAGGRAIVGGFSMGGYVLLALLREYPASVAAAMLIDTRADADSAEVRANRYKLVELIDQQGAAGAAQVFDAMVPKLLRKKPAPEMLTKARLLMEAQAGHGGAGAANALFAMAKRRDQSDLLAGLTVPVLVLVGAEDGITPPSVALAMQSHMPHAMAVQIVAAGHLSPVEQAGPVNGAIETFLTTVK
jgi:pimeloyl-ACP methyl ester carboxylesterase